ncbi:MAG: TetR family transcriptional regulator C-terminal domain-containing protein [Olsenella sp.]|nr:TetR family transcriptional regulator C-terminal domain-containing protein [Olsenella sp.]MCH3956327.1 TetR family transcriptional regulator C-terminal domain-containing protein [Olsenella sp.]MCI1667242.1 TetR family transcriptional regulator C-terminal domain-containing protein [Olsenella sp.]MCI2156299.1 TetR family transcriptional regulator C-terminal domain-containing protein [Olsenella sp.]MCI2183996.1 TetR family transcriptional regulator C-terminal domain-containing protein [Olsenell
MSQTVSDASQAAGDVLPLAHEVPQATDRRTRRTRLALRDALAEEITATGDLSRVTVTAVTGRAGVTRRTFYSHYKDISDLVNCIEKETIAALRPLVAQLSSVHLDELSDAINHQEPCPGSQEILSYVKERGSYLRPLLGKGGDPAFSQRLRAMVHEVVAGRALDGIDLRAVGAFFDYYLTFAISAEVGVLLRWLEGGMHESVRTMARIMTALMFVRPGDLYDSPIELDLPGFALAVMLPDEEDNN